MLAYNESTSSCTASGVSAQSSAEIVSGLGLSHMRSSIRILRGFVNHQHFLLTNAAMIETPTERLHAKVLFGTDCVGNLNVQHLEFKYRSQFFSSLDILRQATSNGGEALRMSGKLYPFPGDLGVIKEGAMADMLIVKDNPLDDVTILSDYDEQLLLIMKDGKVYKNML